MFSMLFLLVLFLSEAGTLLQTLLYMWFQVPVQGPVVQQYPGSLLKKKYTVLDSTLQLLGKSS